MNAAELSRALGGDVTPELVRHWRHGRRDPELKILPAIARALDIDVQYILVELGLLPRVMRTDVQMELVHRVTRLQDEIRTFESREASVRSINEYGRLAQAVSESGRWGLAIHPFYAGLVDARVHVADRLVLRSIDGSDISEDQIPKSIRTSLRALRAWPSEAPGWPLGGGPTASTDTQNAFRYSVDVVSRPRSPAADRVNEGAHSILVLSTSVQAWPSHVSAHLADALGFGLTSSRDSASIATDRPIAQTRPEDWAMFGEQLIEFPPAHHVYHHSEAAGIEASETLRVLSRFLETRSIIVWLRESDEVLRFASERRTRATGSDPAEDFALSVDFRDRMSALLETRSGPVIRVPVDLPLGVDLATTRVGASGPGIIDAVDRAAGILSELVVRDLIDRSDIRDSGGHLALTRAETLGLPRWGGALRYLRP